MYTSLCQDCFCSQCFYCWYPTETKAAVTDPDVEGIEYIDEKVDGENNNIERDEETKSELDEDSDRDSDREEREGNSGALHINTVNLDRSPRENERARFRVCVEITHPALKLPVYRTWTGKHDIQSDTEIHYKVYIVKNHQKGQKSHSEQELCSCFVSLLVSSLSEPNEEISSSA